MRLLRTAPGSVWDCEGASVDVPIGQTSGNVQIVAVPGGFAVVDAYHRRFKRHDCGLGAWCSTVTDSELDGDASYVIIAGGRSRIVVLVGTPSSESTGTSTATQLRTLALA